MWKRVQGAWRRHGPRKFFGLVIHNIRYYLSRLLPTDGVIDRADREFDETFGTDTSDIREVGSLDVRSANARYAVRYQPTNTGLFKRIMQGLEIESNRYEFVDFGSGKGRILLLASSYPFRRITGVEFSRELHEIAQRNIAVYRDPAQRCKDVTSVCCDATEFLIPVKPLVCFFYNPFSAEVMRQVISDIEDSQLIDPGDVYIIYVDPVQKDIFERSGLWHARRTDGQHVVYQYGRPQQANTRSSPSINCS